MVVAADRRNGMSAVPKPGNYVFEGHAVVFQYEDVPGEWHAYCLENGAAGRGSNFQEALHEMIVTLAEQFQETMTVGIDYFFTHPDVDPDWVEAYKSGKHPDKNVHVKGNIRFALLFTGKNRRPRVGRISLASGSPALSIESNHVFA